LRLEKSVQTDSHGTVLWSSTPLIVTFNAQAKSVSISLPPLATLQQAISFNQQPEIHLYDECNKRLDNQQDRLFSNKEESFERAMMHYNIKGHIASVPRFAHFHSLEQIPFSNNNLYFASEADTQNYSHMRILQLWYAKMGSATRQRLALLLRALHAS
ncbi:hypothetical protein ETR_01984, partial [Erwinia tracheiphila PSU-1]